MGRYEFAIPHERYCINIRPEEYQRDICFKQHFSDYLHNSLTTLSHCHLWMSYFWGISNQLNVFFNIVYSDDDVCHMQKCEMQIRPHIQHLETHFAALSLWRNRLARSAVNRKVGGSSPPRDGHILCPYPLVHPTKFSNYLTTVTQNILQNLTTGDKCSRDISLEWLISSMALRSLVHKEKENHKVKSVCVGRESNPGRLLGRQPC